jgi:putative ABC transport system permease protein
MARTVPLARRNLFQDRRRAALAVGGVGVSLVLVLVMQGIFAGAMRQVTRYLDRLPADVIVSQDGITTMHMSSSALPLDTVDDVASRPGVAWAEAIRFTTGVLTGPDGIRQLSYVIGFDTTTDRSGPRRLTTGAPPQHGEGVLDQLGADQLGVTVGDRIDVGGTRLRISGLSEGGTSITNTTLFVPFEDMAAIQPDAVSYVLAGAEPGISPADLRDQLAGALPDVTVQTREQFSDAEARIVADMSADVMRIMNLVGLGIALAVIGLALFTLTLAKLREYGVVKAMGARPRRLLAIIATQATWTVAASLTLAVALTAVAGAVVTREQPSVEIVLVPGQVARTGLAALVVGAIGAVVPLRRLLALDPASAFRRSA